MTGTNQSQEFPKEGDTSSSATSETRRTLIKGTVVAAPVVMTLRSGAAMAMASNEQCIADDQIKAQTAQDDGKLAKFRNNNPNNVETFLRKEVTWGRANRIMRDPTDTFWIFDKNSSGNIRRTQIYNSDTASPPSGPWFSTGEPQDTFVVQNTGTPIDVYDSATTGPGVGPIVVTGIHFLRDTGGRDFVLETSRLRFGLLIFDPNTGTFDLDPADNPRIGKFPNTGGLVSNHITGSCWASLNPNQVYP